MIIASQESQFYSTYTQASSYHVRTCLTNNSCSSSGRYCTTLPSCFVLFWFYHLHSTKTRLRKREERRASEDKPLTPTTASALLTNLYMLLISWLAARILTWSSFSVDQPGAKRSLVLGHQRFHFKPEALSCPVSARISHVFVSWYLSVSFTDNGRLDSTGCPHPSSSTHLSFLLI